MNDVHAIDGTEIWVMVALKNFLSQINHLLNRYIKAVADFFEKNIDNMKVDDQNVSIQRSLNLQLLIFVKKHQQKVS